MRTDKNKNRHVISGCDKKDLYLRLKYLFFIDNVI
jgi:hypothetical protein